ncbi:acyl-CoA synthetase [Rhodococcus erythropolis]|uniref:acyl-CoA synthetase n=1 Tax=Rhodococcus erythropolis TaxID=1833 RepID=UPI00210D64C2|nr:acyl-CoA synthetase [Rhodococcus erythropolis]MCQ4129195.1 acyl-CoA synthetase [Rhodococcus erythropolis]
MNIIHKPFGCESPITSIDDVRRLEQVPLSEAVQVRSTYELFCNAAAAFGDQTAIVFVSDADNLSESTNLSYQELLRHCHRTANLLHTLGLGNNEVVSILMPACPEYHFAIWGGSAAGIVQPLNPLLSEDKLAALMTAAGSRVLIAWGVDDDAPYWSRALALQSRVPTLKTVVRVAPHGETTHFEFDTVEPVVDFGSALAEQVDDRLVSGRDIGSDDIAAYFHTGGTTSDPKLARLSHGAQVFTAWTCVQLQGLTAAHVSINGYPLFHVAGVLVTSLPSFASGGVVVIPTTTLFRNSRVIRNYWHLVEYFRATELSAVPTSLAALVDVPLGGADISSLRYCRTGAAPLSADLAKRFDTMSGTHVHECLGMTEMAGITAVTPPGVLGPAGCVGFPPPYSQMRIVDADDDGRPTDHEVPDEQVGLVLFKSPNVFSGYVDEADNDGVMTPDGWLVTGDLGWRDHQGRLNFAGRAKDLIIRGGHNIDPQTIEDALHSHPAVEMAAAVGAPDTYAGELPVAFVTLVPGAVVTMEELLAHTVIRVDEPPARPKRITVLDSMPVTGVGKLFKPKLRQLAAIEVVDQLLQLHLDGPNPTVRVEARGLDEVLVLVEGNTDPAEIVDAARGVLARLGVKGTVIVQPHEPKLVSTNESTKSEGVLNE